MRRWDALVERYSRLCEARGLASNTIERRRRELERLGAWLKRRRPKPRLEEVESELLIGYIRARTAFHSKSTVSGVVSEVRCMGEFLVREGLWQANPLRWIRGPKLDPRQRLPKRIGRQHLAKLWEAAQNRREQHGRYQAVCLLAILYGTGLRRGELERLDVDDWDRDEGILKIDGRKTGQARHVPVGAGVWRCIEAYLPHRHNLLEKTQRLGEPALLVNRFGERMKAEDVSATVHRLAKRAGVPWITLHQFRHSCASDLLEAGVSLPEVQRVLGHAVIESTVRYIDITDPERVSAMGRHPIGEFLAEEARREAS